MGRRAELGKVPSTPARSRRTSAIGVDALLALAGSLAEAHRLAARRAAGAGCVALPAHP
jgi:hypothetical protein